MKLNVLKSNIIIIKDILTPNDFIAEASLRFEEEAKNSFNNDLSVKIQGTSSFLRVGKSL